MPLNLFAKPARMFTPEEMHTYLGKLERELNETADVLDNDELLPDNPAAAAERVERFTIIKELLTATELGTS